MVAVPIRYDMDRFFDQLHGADTIRPLGVQMDVIKIIVCEGLSIASAIPPKRLHYIYSLRQLVETDSTFQHGIV